MFGKNMTFRNIQLHKYFVVSNSKCLGETEFLLKHYSKNGFQGFLVYLSQFFASLKSLNVMDFNYIKTMKIINTKSERGKVKNTN